MEDLSYLDWHIIYGRKGENMETIDKILQAGGREELGELVEASEELACAVENLEGRTVITVQALDRMIAATNAIEALRANFKEAIGRFRLIDGTPAELRSSVGLRELRGREKK